MTKKEERKYLFDMYGGKCSYCGCELGDKWHADHKEPVRRLVQTIYDSEKQKYRYTRIGMENPHLDTLENKTPSCASCNINKHAMGVEEFRLFIQGFIDTLNRHNVCYKVAKRYGLLTETGNKVEFYFERHNNPKKGEKK